MGSVTWNTDTSPANTILLPQGIRLVTEEWLITIIGGFDSHPCYTFFRLGSATNKLIRKSEKNQPVFAGVTRIGNGPHL